MGATKVATTRNERVELLERIAWGSQFTQRQLQLLAGYVQVYDAPQGTQILNEGSTDVSMGLLFKGLIKIFKDDDSGSPQEVGTIRPGTSFGEMSLIDGGPRSATVVAAQDSTILMLSDADFAKLEKDVPGLALAVVKSIAKLISQRLRAASGRLVERHTPTETMAAKEKEKD